jgi:hypothetical protein
MGDGGVLIWRPSESDNTDTHCIYIRIQESLTLPDTLYNEIYKSLFVWY